ncbi:L-aspartate oxidase [Halorhodospira halochloris]|uniref:L-aspartate oxidase n=1 Tax=Halorhodospira halochloris TaxID=1052 RepID=A0A120MZZ9_HALHR|nr:L-aspartate oxidase [Halorhodospira halochloris]MBK1652020.1 L-aspartate oxidase [Halorhodospira halochloris]MCG5530904.1 L-aspartate oxidase [Halorhodospira halochloris]MCG5547882.1 L-aspartate oxidase [Halorhodospira halochloris]BAU58318.1 L-aspartate oxidase [Halorhodospira halochloris]
MAKQRKAYDVLIIGTGLAGLTVALQLPERLRIGILSKGAMTDGATPYAQGGVSAAIDATDSVDAHVEDTLEAGAGLSDHYISRLVATQAREAIEWLIDKQVPFSRIHPGAGTTGLHLHQEGGHSHRRVVHAEDATGLAISHTLTSIIERRANIELLEGRYAIDLITGSRLGLAQDRCYGAYVYNSATELVELIHSPCAVLACGGASKVYLYSTSPYAATGDGIAMAWRAGCRVANLEFNQFHPTCLYHPQERSFLISEAVRGEGGKLLLPDGQRFMDRFDERGELAPRDVVARAIDHEMKRLGADCLYLDISHRPAELIRERFPNIHKRCLELGLDMTRDPLPVVPAAHYTCGGVVTDEAGRTGVPGLYAVGETACTGLHGANRLASNSLLECLIFGSAAARDIAASGARHESLPQLPAWDESRVTDSDEQVVVSHNWAEIRRAMWNYVGIVRTDRRLERASRRIDLLMREVHEFYTHFRVSGDLIELRNLILVAQLTVRCAARRRESRGLHYTLDFPSPDEAQKSSTLLVPARPRPFAHLRSRGR